MFYQSTNVNWISKILWKTHLENRQGTCREVIWDLEDTNYSTKIADVFFNKCITFEKQTTIKHTTNRKRMDEPTSNQELLPKMLCHEDVDCGKTSLCREPMKLLVMVSSGVNWLTSKFYARFYGPEALTAYKLIACC